MFGKEKYVTKEEFFKVIKEINETTKGLLEITKSLRDDLNTLQENVMDLARNEATHKEAITFLFKYSTIRPEGEEEFLKLLKKIKENNKSIKKK